MKIIKFLLVMFLCLFSLTIPVFAENIDQGKQIFEVHCAGCHINGGNIIRRGKNLKQKALKRYKIDTSEAIINLVTNGKNNMSAFGDILSREEIENVSVYVLKQASQNWK